MEEQKKTDLFDTLEQRLDRILEGYTTVKEEREKVVSELCAKEEEVARLREEISLLKSEKSQVRNRIARLIERLEKIP